MISSILHYLETVVLPLGGWGVFIGSIIEEIIAPIPSTLVQMGGGFLLLGDLPIDGSSLFRLFFVVVLPAAAGLTIGSFFLYALGKYFGKPAIERWGDYFGLKWPEVESTAKRFSTHKRAFWLLLFFRSIPVLPSVVVSTVAGVVHFPVGQYAIASVIGTLFRASILGFLGWQLGRAYMVVAHGIERFEKVGFVLLFVLFLTWQWHRKNKKRKGHSTEIAF